MSEFLSAQDIFDAVDLEIVEQSVPEWKDKLGKPGRIRLRQLSAEDALALSAEMETAKSAREGMYLILIKCAVDQNGNALFTVDDLPKLKRKSIKALNRLQRAALKLNDMFEFSAKTEVDLKKD